MRVAYRGVDADAGLHAYPSRCACVRSFVCIADGAPQQPDKLIAAYSARARRCRIADPLAAAACDAAVDMPASFDRVAHIYRWGEYLSFGPLLALCRRAHVDALARSQHALIIGDGDGRFTHLALRTHPHLRVTAVDVSGTMLALLRERCEAYADRLTTIQADISQLSAPLHTFDTIVTHFLLDCLSTHDVQDLIRRVSGARIWIVSDFEVPRGAMRLPALVLVRTLYIAFRILAGLRNQHLPAWRDAMAAAEFQRTAERRYLGGILFSALWERNTRRTASITHLTKERTLMGTQPVGDVVNPGVEGDRPGNDLPNTPTGPVPPNEGVELPTEGDPTLPGEGGTAVEPAL